MQPLVILIGLVEAIAVAAFLFIQIKKKAGNAKVVAEGLRAEVQLKQEVVGRLEGLTNQLIDPQEVKSKVRELVMARESLKAERGRVTITQAELETIEVRLRELDEIARELEASALETKEELKILQKKEKELNQKNESLKQQIAQSLSQIDQVLSQIELTSQMQEQVDNMRAELVRTETQIAQLLTSIQQGNEQYFILKKRYDALDIEYAQLYEKFSEQQAAG